MNGWWLYLLAVVVLAAPVIGMVLRRRLLRSRLGPGPRPDSESNADPTRRVRRQ